MKLDLKQQTVDTYNKSAKQLAEYFRGIGSRVEDIERGLKLAGSPKNARVLEIGCGDGRDAQEIVKRAEWYLGFDISRELIKLAKELVPNAEFKIVDATNFDYPTNLDVVFAFASLLHLDKNEVEKVLERVRMSLKAHGIFYISLKDAPGYEANIKNDQYGTRQFFLYNPELIQELATKGYKTVYLDQYTIGNTAWFDIALRRIT